MRGMGMGGGGGGMGRGGGGGGGRGMSADLAHGIKAEDFDAMPILRKVFPLLWPANDTATRVTVVLSFVLLLGSKILELFVPIALMSAVNDLTVLQFPTTAVILFGVFRFGGELLVEMRTLTYAMVSAKIEKKIASDVFAHLQALGLRFHLERKTGSVLRSCTRGASSFSEVARSILFQFVPIIIQILIVVIYLFVKYNWVFAVVTLITIVCYFTFTISTTQWRDQYRRTMMEKDNEFNQRATDALLNFETVKYFCAEEHEQVRYEQALQEYREAQIKAFQSMSVLNLGQSFFITVGVVLAMWFASAKMLAGSMQIGDFVLINQFILMLYGPIAQLGFLYRMTRQLLIDVESMCKLMEEPIEIQDEPDALPMAVSKGEIVFENVVFCYEPKTISGKEGREILKNISFKVPAGTSLAIVGPSGSGKSTIARCLYRFYDLKSGRVLIDGQDVSKVKQQSLRTAISIVPQDTVLFNDSIGYNIGYGSVAHGELASQQQIEEVARAASLHDFIRSREEGYDARVGERGLRLSGGEKQRVGIARAILKRPSIFVFDEATSSLDTHTEREIQKSLEAASRGYTSITIAHRLSTIMNSDNILVLKHGEIVEQGTHNNLLAANGEYARMWNSQQQAMEIEAKIKAMREQAESLNIDAMSPRDPTEAGQPSADSLRSLPNVAAAAQRVIKEAQHSSKV